jgi:repressor LexA
MEIVWDKVWQVLGIPLLSKVPAGNPRLPSAEQLGMLTPNELYPYGEGIYSLQVHGDSMKDAGIHDGDIVLVQEQYEAKHGDIVVAVIENDESEGEMTVKRLVHRKGKHYLEPANPYYKPIELNGGKIVGVVIQVIRKLKK